MADSEEYLGDVSDAVLARLQQKGWSALSPAEQQFVCVWKFEGEVDNGGFNEFYASEAGDHAAATVTALESIGAKHTAAIVRKGNALFGPTGPAAVRAVRQARLESIAASRESELADLDAAYYEYRDNLSQLLHAFVVKNKSKIKGA